MKEKYEYGLVILRNLIDELYPIKNQIVNKEIFDTTKFELTARDLERLLLPYFDYKIPPEFKKVKKEHIFFPKKIRLPDTTGMQPSAKIETLRAYEETYKISPRKINFFNVSIDRLKIIKNKYPNCLGELQKYIVDLRYI